MKVAGENCADIIQVGERSVRCAKTLNHVFLSQETEKIAELKHIFLCPPCAGQKMLAYNIIGDFDRR